MFLQTIFFKQHFNIFNVYYSHPSYVLEYCKFLNIFFSGIILSAFFYGYLVLQIPGGWLALRIGAKRIMGFSILTASIISVLLPIIVRYSCVLFIAARVLQGLVLVSCILLLFLCVTCRWSLLSQQKMSNSCLSK